MSDLRLASRLALPGFALALAVASPAVAGSVIIDSEVAGPVNVISRDSIEVLPGARISGGMEGIIGAGENRVTIRREGRVGGTVSGLDLAGGDSVLNQGQIFGGVYGINFGGEASLVNSGKIQGDVFGLYAIDKIEVLNLHGGEISGGVYGIDALAGLVLQNHGSVSGSVFGVYGGGNNSIRNWGSIYGGVYGVDSIGTLDLYNYGGQIRGGVFGVYSQLDAAIRNWGEIEGGIYGIDVIGKGSLWNYGRITGGFYGVYVERDARIFNHNTIEGGVYGTYVNDNAEIWNYGRLTGGTYGMYVNGRLDLRNWGFIQGGTYGVYAQDDSRIWNWGQIRGDIYGILGQGDSFYLRNGGKIWGGEFGVYTQSIHSQIENFGAIIGDRFGVFSDATFSDVRNHGTIGGNQVGIFFNGDASLTNHGVVRGGLASVEVGGGPSTLTLGGTGYYIGDVVGSPAAGDRLHLDLIGVPKEVKQSLLRRQGALSGPLHIPVFNINARDFEFLDIERLISFQEEAGGDFGSVGRSLDWRDITRDGSKSAFVEGFGALVDDEVKFRDALENVSGRSISHSASDMAFANTEFWNRDIGGYLDLKRDKSIADAKAGLTTSPWGGFAKATGIFADQDRTENRQDGDWTVNGAYLGGDYTLDKRITLGAFGGYTRSEADVDDFGSTLSSDDVHGGIYGVCGHGPVSIDGAAWYSHHDYDSKRTLELPTFSQQAQARFDGDQVSTYLRTAYNWRPSFDDRWEISPRLALGYSHLWVDGWKEQSEPSRLGLELEDQEADSLRTSLGTRVAGRFDFGKVVLQPEFRVDWLHEYLDDGRSIKGSWSSSAFQSFQTESEVDDRDSAILGAGLTLNVPVCDCMKKLEFYAGYDVQLGRNEFRGQVANFRVSYQY